MSLSPSASRLRFPNIVGTLRPMLTHSSLVSFAVSGVFLSFVACQPRSSVESSAPAASPGAAVPTAQERVAADPIDKALVRPDPIAISEPIPGFARGINLGNCFDAPSEGAWGTSITENHFRMAAEAKLDHVRLPVRWSTPNRTMPAAPYTIDPAFFARIDWAIEQALSRGLSIMINVHHYEEIHKEPRAHLPRLYAMWEQIATRYADRPATVAFEILNEPNGALESSINNELTAEVIRIIRRSNPTRLVFADPYFWAAADHLNKLELPADDPNVVAQFHMYQPILFTHQGAPWMEPWCQTTSIIFPGPPKTPITPTSGAQSEGWVMDWLNGYNTAPPATNPSGPAAVFAYFDHAARWVKETKKRAYLGEFGAIDIADAQSRHNYVWLVRTEAERRGMGWAYWDDGGKFKAMDVGAGTWNETIRSALLEP